MIKRREQSFVRSVRIVKNRYTLVHRKDRTLSLDFITKPTQHTVYIAYNIYNSLRLMFLARKRKNNGCSALQIRGKSASPAAVDRSLITTDLSRGLGSTLRSHTTTLPLFFFPLCLSLPSVSLTLYRITSVGARYTRAVGVLQTTPTRVERQTARR